jgi:hypothetical protein
MSRELNRASLFFRYIREENDHHKSLFNRGRQEILESLRNVKVDPDAVVAEKPASHPPQPNNSPASQDETSAPKPPELSVDVKKVYRKIVQETHPDKTEKMGLPQKDLEKRVNAYKRATEAAGKADADTLVEIAVDLEIETGLDDLKIAESLFRRAKILEDEIQKIKGTTEWIWIHVAEDKKIEIIREICKRNGWIYVTDDQITESVKRVLGVHPGSRAEVMRRARSISQKRRQIS